MRRNDNLSRLACPLRGARVALLMAVAPLAHATEVWTGPTIIYKQPAAYQPGDLSTVDQITGDVWFTRGSGKPPFNAAPPYNETSYNGTTSPENTEWAFGNISQYASLTYDTWANVIGGEQGGDLSTSLPNQPLVMHIITDDIYLSIEFSSWTHGGAGFTYQRSTPAVSMPAPTVAITNPVAGAVFSAPANLKIGASASVSSGTVTNVAFFATSAATTNSLGSAQSSPFKITSSSLAAGSFSLFAVAAAAGISTTSSVVKISVVAPLPLSNSVPAVAAGRFSFNYDANVGLTYVVLKSLDLSAWIPVVTNVASSNPASFSESAVGRAAGFYQVVRQPNP